MTEPTMKPKITVVVPMYNLELYVERCLESLAAQTLRELEVLVVDDGSTDDTPALVEELAARHPGIIRSLRKENGGHGSACNHGIERATGEYVMIVDGDDYLDADTAEYMYAKAKAVDADLLIGNLRYVAPHRVEPHRPIACATEKTLGEADWPALFSNWATPCARLYRRALFDDPLLRFLPGVLFADVSFAPKTYLAARRIHYVNRELYNYDITRPDQSLKRTDRRILDVVPALRDVFRFYDAHGAFEDCRSELLEYTIRHCGAWVAKVQRLHGYPRGKALAEIFAVLDERFGDAWVASPVLREVAGPRRALLLQTARAVGYAPAVLAWEVRDALIAADAGVERALTLPLRAYRKVRGMLTRTLPGGRAA